MFLIAAVILLVVGTLAHAHAVLKHLRPPYPSASETPDLYWNTSYYTPRGRHLIRFTLWLVYPAALLLVALQLASWLWR